VLYMHDGGIVHDQRTPLGEIPHMAKQAVTQLPRKDEEDDLAGVSAMMGFRPDKPAKPSKLTKRKVSAKPRKSKAKITRKKP